MKLTMTAFPDGRAREVGVAWVQDGLCVHRSIADLPEDGSVRYGKGWNVAHRTGFYLAIGLRTKAKALAVAQRILPLADWTQPAEVLKTCPSLKRDLRAVRDQL